MNEKLFLFVDEKCIQFGFSKIEIHDLGGVKEIQNPEQLPDSMFKDANCEVYSCLQPNFKIYFVDDFVRQLNLCNHVYFIMTKDRNRGFLIEENKIYYDKPKNIIPGDQIKIVDVIGIKSFCYLHEDTYPYPDEGYNEEFLNSICHPFNEDIRNFIKMKDL